MKIISLLMGCLILFQISQGIAQERSSLVNERDLKEMYIESMSEFYRVLSDKGLLIFKCQDLVYNHKQFLTHVFVINRAEIEGFFCHDCIVLIRDNVLLSAHIQKQQHARKTHSYYLVFSKGLPTSRALDGGESSLI